MDALFLNNPKSLFFLWYLGNCMKNEIAIFSRLWRGWYLFFFFLFVIIGLKIFQPRISSRFFFLSFFVVKLLLHIKKKINNNNEPSIIDWLFINIANITNIARGINMTVSSIYNTYKYCIYTGMYINSRISLDHNFERIAIFIIFFLEGFPTKKKGKKYFFVLFVIKLKKKN